MYVMYVYVYKTASRFTSAHKYKLIKFLTLYLPEDICLVKNSPLFFSHNSESLPFLNESSKRLILH